MRVWSGRGRLGPIWCRLGAQRAPHRSQMDPKRLLPDLQQPQIAATSVAATSIECRRATRPPQTALVFLGRRFEYTLVRPEAAKNRSGTRMGHTPTLNDRPAVLLERPKTGPGRPAGSHQRSEHLFEARTLPRGTRSRSQEVPRDRNISRT